MTEVAPESCHGAELGPSLVPIHASVSPFSPPRAELMDQLCVRPSPAPPLPVYSLTPVSCLPSPKHPCSMLSVSLLLNWDRGGAGGGLCGGKKNARGRRHSWVLC